LQLLIQGGATIDYNTTAGFTFRVTSSPANFSNLQFDQSRAITSGCNQVWNINTDYCVTSCTPPTVSASSTNAGCNGSSPINNGTVTINASGGSGSGYQYAFNGGAWGNTRTFTGLAAGTYVVYATTDATDGSCASSFSVSVGQDGCTVPCNLSVNLGPNQSVCSNQSITLSSSVSGQNTCQGASCGTTSVNNNYAPGATGGTKK